MKAAAQFVVSFLKTFFILYLPMSFAAWSFNPAQWSHTERFIFAVFFWLSISYHVIKPFIPKPVYKP